MKLRLLLLVAFLGFNENAIAQVKFGFELNAYSSKLTDISPDTFMRWGHSGAKSTLDASFRIAPTLLVRKSFGKRISLETGVGYIANKHNIRLQYGYVNDNFFRPALDTILNISLKYIQVPVSVLYSFSLNDNTSLNLSAGLKTRFLLSFEDNYPGIIYEQRGISSFRYNKIVYTPTVGIALENKLPKGQTCEIGFFGTYNANSLVNKKLLWGYFYNLEPAKNRELGILFKFFF